MSYGVPVERSVPRRVSGAGDVLGLVIVLTQQSHKGRWQLRINQEQH